jgi:hypothetical protein
MHSDGPNRRDILQTTAAFLAGSTVVGESATPAPADSTASDAVPTTAEEIRAAFDDVPHLDEPTQRERRSARQYYPDIVVPNEGPIPDPQHKIAVTLDAPPWLLASAYDKSRSHGTEATYQGVEDRFLSRYQAWEEWRLPDGSDAVEAIVQAIKEADGD